MPRLRVPSYLHHKQTGQARVKIRGKVHYLGKYGSTESYARYDDLIAELVTNRESPTGSAGVSLNEVLAAFWNHAKERYGKHGRGPYGHAINWRGTIRMLRESCGKSSANDIRPKQVKSIILTTAAKHQWSRQYANQKLAQVKAIYKWAAAEELVSVESYQRLSIIEGLRVNGSELPEAPPVEPVSDDLVDATLPLLKPVVADMVRFQRLTGTRPGEVVRMQVGEVDRSGEIWSYTPGHHKTAHHGKSRKVFIGPRAQAIIAKYLLKESDRRVFEYRRGRGYSTDSYRRAVQRRLQRHGMTSWHPNQLRHTAGTEVRAAFDIETASAALGHANVKMSEHYARIAEDRAKQAAKLLG